MERKESSLAAKEETLRKRSSEVEELFAKEQEELEKISGLTSEQAKEYLLKSVEEDVKHDTAKLIKELEAKKRKKLTRKPKNMWLPPSRDVQLTMWLRLQFLSFSSRAMR